VKIRLAACVAASVLFASSAHAELFKYKGKAYDAKDLSPTMQQNLHELQSESFLRMESFVDQVIFETYVEDEAKKAGKTRAQIEEGLFKTSEPSDKEVAEWYEGNKGRLPPGYKLEQIAGDIKQLLKGEQKKKQFQELMAKIKKDGNVTLGFAEPEAPFFKIDTAGYPVKGAAAAKLTIVEFADYQCPHCKQAGAAIEKVLKKFDGKVNLVYMDFPVKGEASTVVSHGAVCADQQGKFWEYNTMAFDQQQTLTKDSPAALAKSLKLDEGKFKTCMESKAPAEKVAKAKAEGDKIGLTGTPGLFLNGRRLRGFDEEELMREIEKAVKKGGAS